MVTVSIDWRCPAELSGWSVEYMPVEVRQAAGKQIAFGRAEVQSGFERPLVCDGSARHITSNVFADTSGPPFKGGAAVATVHIGAVDQYYFSSWSEDAVATITLKTTK